MQTKITTVAIAAFLAATVSAQTPVTESAERVVQLTNTPTRQGFQEMATVLRTVAQISNLTIDSEHNSFDLRGTPGDLYSDGRMDDSHDGQICQLAAIQSGDVEPSHARVPCASRSRTGRAGLLPHQHHVSAGLAGDHHSASHRG